jgi:hypothetical protein
MDRRFGSGAMSAALFDPDAIVREVRAKANLPLPATTATLRRNAAQSRNVAIVARGEARDGGAKCRNVAIVATPSATIDASGEAEAEMIERADLCAGSVPAAYLDAWARLNCQKPMRVSEAEWRQALDDGGRFLDAWGEVAAGWGWTASALVDVPRPGKSGGLFWFIDGAKVEAFGPDHARLDDGRIFDRGTTGGEHVSYGA